MNAAQRNQEAFWRRYRQDDAGSMSKIRFHAWINKLPREEFFAMIDVYHPPARKTRSSVRARPTRKAPPKPTLVRSDDLCKELVCIAAFNLNDAPHAQMKVYETIRTLQLLDRAAIEAGILP